VVARPVIGEDTAAQVASKGVNDTKTVRLEHGRQVLVDRRPKVMDPAHLSSLQAMPRQPLYRKVTPESDREFAQGARISNPT
jgi:hypothetical protein